jgi:hypothetical protein
MKQNIIKTDNYLLIVDEDITKAKEGCWIIRNGIEPTFCGEHFFFDFKEPYKKIIYHLPLSNSRILEGVDLLPPLENEVEKLAKEVATKRINPFNPIGSIMDTNLQHGFKSGYNKAKEKYKYTEEHLRKCWKACLDFNKPAGSDSGINLEDFIQSLQQPKYPIGFECEIEKKEGKLMVIPPCKHCIKPKTTTNSQGQTVLEGKYIYGE